jgi:Lantibiotic dehydratase, N terminus
MTRTGEETATATPAEGGPVARDGWRRPLAEPFMLRLAGLPVRAVDGLRGAAGARWADEVLAAQERLAELGRSLSDPLAQVVGATEDEAVRREVLRLRRAVFNNRPPADPAAAPALAERVGGRAGTLLAAWLADRARLEELLAGGPRTLADDLAGSRAALKALAADERLRDGLLLASPALDAQLDGYLRDDGRLAAKRVRKIERSLLAYLYRTACKTSPFSTFTGVALGAFRPREGAAGRIEVAEEWSSHPRLNVVVLWRLAQVIAEDPERLGDLPVELASGFDLDDERVRYVRRSMTPGDDEAAVSFDAAQDRLFFLRRHGVLDSLIALFGTRPVIRHRELADWLCAEHGAKPDDAQRYLAALTHLGMVRPAGLHPQVHSPDPVREFQGALRAVGRPWADKAADGLDGVTARVDGYPAAPLAARRELLEGLRGELRSLLAALDAPEATLPRALLYEDTRAAREEVVADAGYWRELATGPLNSLGRILPAFDVSLPQRLTLKGFFLARFGRGGRCEDVLKFVHDFHEDIFDQYLRFTAQRPATGGEDGYPAEENWLGLPQLTALDQAREAFADRMRQAWERRDPQDEEIRLTDADIDAVADRLRPLTGGFDPVSHFLQLADRPGDPLMVLNGSFGGLSFPFTRFTHCFDGGEGPDLTGLLTGQLRRAQPGEAVFAEVTAGAATTNLNLHGRMTEYQILCPGETTSAPPQARIHLDDLYVEHDPDQDRLVVRSRRLGREVVPLYLGYLVPMVLPEIPRTLLLLSPTSKATLRPWTGVPARQAVDGVTTRPRVRLGPLVLARRSWSVPAGALPVAAAGTGDAERYLGWRRWQRAHRVPGRVFARVHRDADGSGGWSGGSKPHYVDFDSPLSLNALEGLLGEGAAHVVLEEMLPAQEELTVRTGRGEHVAELAVEIIPNAADTGRNGED